MIDPADLVELEPTSEVRPVDGTVRRLVIDTGLRGSAAEGAWVTVTDDVGTVRFEGTPSADGCVEVVFDGGPESVIARVLLETATAHRQAQVRLGAGWTAHSFA